MSFTRKFSVSSWLSSKQSFLDSGTLSWQQSDMLAVLNMPYQNFNSHNLFFLAGKTFSKALLFQTIQMSWVCQLWVTAIVWLDTTGEGKDNTLSSTSLNSITDLLGYVKKGEFWQRHLLTQYQLKPNKRQKSKFMSNLWETTKYQIALQKWENNKHKGSN